MKRIAFVTILLCAGIAGSSFGNDIIHFAVGPGVLYPNTPNKLLKAVEDLYAEADPLTPDYRLLACVAPHSAIGLSGKVAASAFKGLKPGQYNRVIVLGPAHYATFEGCSIASVEAYETPLGLVPVDLKAVEELTRCGLISSRALRYRPNTFLKVEERDGLHEAEHSIEMVLPFLQVKLGEFELIPILVGNLTDTFGPKTENTAEVIASEIRKQLKGRTLLVVSTDLTHFGIEHRYHPFSQNIIPNIEALDNRACEIICNHDFEAFSTYLDRTRNPICGRSALQVLFKILPNKARGLLLAQDMEAKITGNDEFTVSYAAINFYDLEHPPIEAPAQTAPDSILPPADVIAPMPQTSPLEEEPGND